jgi:hypothetical protein
MHGWVSPLTKVCFELHPADTDLELKLFEPDGAPFQDYLEVVTERDALALERNYLAGERNYLQQELEQERLRNREAEERIQQLLAHQAE